MKVLLIGANGYIGNEFLKYLEADNIPYNCFGSRNYDYRFWKEHVSRYDIVINVAGYTGKPNVDVCESNKDKAIMDNVFFPEILAQACEANGNKLFHVSSGCIYNGYDKDFSEEDEPNFSFKQNNCSFYSGTKAMAEERLIEYENVWIGRLRIPFDEFESPRNYITKLMNYDTLLNLRNSLSHKEDFVSLCMSIINEDVETGIYNICNHGSMNAEEVCYLLNKYKVTDKKFEFFDSLETFNTGVIAPRSNCILNTDKIGRLFYVRTIQEAMEESISNYIKE